MARFSARFVVAVATLLLGGLNTYGQQDLGNGPEELLTEESSTDQEESDPLRSMQIEAVETKQADWIHWGDQPNKFSNWATHSNRLIPVYSFGITLSKYFGDQSVYRDKEKLKQLYSVLPRDTFDEEARYMDQTDIYRLQRDAFEAGKENIILFVIDGMDWNTTQAASIYKNQRVTYTKGYGEGLQFLDYRSPEYDHGYMVTGPYSRGAKFDVSSQIVSSAKEPTGGYSALQGGQKPWSRPADPSYLMGKSTSQGHPWTDSAASATSMTTGTKTYNGAINVDPEGGQLETIAHQLQKDGFAIGVVTSVPICHATPGSAYAHNVNRCDYQDISRDLLGLRSVSHRRDPLPGVDVLLGAGWGEIKKIDSKQGNNYVPGNKYLADADLKEVDVDNGGKYFVVERHEGENGGQSLADAALLAATDGNRLLGFFGAQRGHLPFQTADGNFNPTRGVKQAERYTKEDVSENPTLAEMSIAALDVLESRKKAGAKGFWLMIEGGDVDWANHNNNIDDAIGSVLSADEAFGKVVQWVEDNGGWNKTALILTADHGHMMVLDDPEALIEK